MSNVLKIAKKELADLLGNIIVPIVIFVYLIIILSSAYGIKDQVSGGIGNEDQFVVIVLSSLYWDLKTYGGILALIIGFYSLSSEKVGSALSTIVAKPVYRDNIINGKLIGCTLFITCIFLLATALYLASLLIIVGPPFGKILAVFLEKSLVIVVLTLVCSLMIMCLSMLISLLVRDRGIALLSCAVLFVFLAITFPSVSFLSNIAMLFGEGEEQVSYIIGSFSPYSMLNTVIYDMLANTDVLSVLLHYSQWIAEFVIGLVIAMAANYIAFVRRDIS